MSSSRPSPVAISELEKKLPEEAEALQRANFPAKTLLVVGATGGIGSCVVEIAGALGAKSLFITYNSNAAGASELAKATGATAVQYSHGTYEAAQSLVEQLPAGMDYLVDASGLPGNSSVARLGKEPELVRQMFDANALGPFFLFVELLNSQKLSQGAQLAYVSTIAVDGHQNQALYAASKAPMGAAVESWMHDRIIAEREIGLKSLELAVVRTKTPTVQIFLRSVEQAERRSPGITAELEGKGYIMTAAEAAYRALAAMADPTRTGRVRIPSYATVEGLLKLLGAGNGAQAGQTSMQ